jgi:hypothetical protein
VLLFKAFSGNGYRLRVMGYLGRGRTAGARRCIRVSSDGARSLSDEDPQRHYMPEIFYHKQESESRSQNGRTDVTIRPFDHLTIKRSRRMMGMVYTYPAQEVLPW